MSKEPCADNSRSTLRKPMNRLPLRDRLVTCETASSLILRTTSGCRSSMLFQQPHQTSVVTLAPIIFYWRSAKSVENFSQAFKRKRGRIDSLNREGRIEDRGWRIEDR